MDGWGKTREGEGIIINNNKQKGQNEMNERMDGRMDDG